MKREVAWRVLAGEYNDSTLEIKGEGDMSPSYLVSPLGAKINRLFIIGVLTDVERLSDSGDLVRAHISDPTGVFTLYSGQYQKDATDVLLNIEVPTFVAVIGKSKTYSPEEGTLFVSVRPEKVKEVNSSIRDQWIYETCISTKERIEAIIEASKMENANVIDLHKLGYNTVLSEGIVAAIKHYEKLDIKKYISIVRESIQYLYPNNKSLEDHIEITKEQSINDDKHELNVKKDDESNQKENFKKIEETVFQIIKDMEGDDGASWDAITEKCKKTGLDDDSIEEALTSLMDKGFIYEPILGTIKTT